MQENLKQLELLVMQLVAKQKELQNQNSSLKQKVRQLEEDSLKLKELEGEIRTLKEWKKNTQTVLRKVATRLDKEIAKAKEKENQII